MNLQFKRYSVLTGTNFECENDPEWGPCLPQSRPKRPVKMTGGDTKKVSLANLTADCWWKNEMNPRISS